MGIRYQPSGGLKGRRALKATGEVNLEGGTASSYRANGESKPLKEWSTFSCLRPVKNYAQF